jgi:hypothetical protein
MIFEGRRDRGHMIFEGRRDRGHMIFEGRRDPGHDGIIVGFTISAYHH